MFGIQLRTSPISSGLSGVVEIGDVNEADRRMVVVSRNSYEVKFHDPVDASCGVRSIADDISQAPNRIEPATVLGVSDNGLKGLQIGVNVR